MRGTKNLITRMVKQYILDCPEDFELVKTAIEGKRRMTRDDYASLEGSNWQRALYEIPEELNTRFILGLNEEEMTWFKTKPAAIWFAREFRVFSLPNKI